MMLIQQVACGMVCSAIVHTVVNFSLIISGVENVLMSQGKIRINIMKPFNSSSLS